MSTKKRKPKYNNGFKFLSDAQVRYIIIRRHIENEQIKQIHAELTDPNADVLYGVQPNPHIDLNYLYERIRRIPNTTIEMVKIEWLNGLLDEPLANKRIRIRELANLYRKTTDEDLKRKLLKDIKDEVGEEAWQAAIKESGNTTISLKEILQRKLTGDQEEED